MMIKKQTPSRAAQHRGECQVCGAVQRLPMGKEALHGYKVEWSCFHGVCWGSKHLPLEQDSSLLAEAIKRASEALNRLTASAAELRIPALEPKAKVPHGGLFGIRTWVSAEFVVTERGGIFIKFEDGTSEPATRYSGYTGFPRGDDRDNPLAHANFWNERHAKEIDENVRSTQRYIEWQKQRIKDWKPKSLQPIKKEAA